MNRKEIVRAWFLQGVTCLYCFLIGAGSFIPSTVSADTKYASKERSTISRAHMSRARTLLVEALAEFEEGRKYARPDLLLDSEDWRLRVVSLTEQLNRVIDPKPRVTREGAVFRTPPRFVKRERDHLPPVTNGAKSRSDFGEKQRLKERQEARARLYEENHQKNNSSKSDDVQREIDSIDELLDEDLDIDKKNEVEDAALKENPKGPVFPNELMPEVSDEEFQEIEEKKRSSLGYDEELISPQEEQEEEPYDDENKDPEDPTAGKSPKKYENDSFDTLPDIISDQEVENVSPDVADSRLIDDEELTRRLEQTLADR
jgi:hypothetical protein